MFHVKRRAKWLVNQVELPVLVAVKFSSAIGGEPRAEPTRGRLEPRAEAFGLGPLGLRPLRLRPLRLDPRDGPTWEGPLGESPGLSPLGLGPGLRPLGLGSG